MTPPEKAIHPGIYVRQNILKPKKLTVTKTADLIGVSRPNTSKFLNGKSAVTPEMAARLERAFKISAQKLLEMQRDYDEKRQDTSKVEEEVQHYVVPFMRLTAEDIERGFSDIRGREELPVFLRLLVHSTGKGLQYADFPGNAQSQRHGWDGKVGTEIANAWIPAGDSRWELGTTEEAFLKFKKDFEYRSNTVKNKENLSFIFVTPRKFSHNNDDKEKYSEKIQSEGWKSVRIYDSSDLEQWLEQSIPAQIWLAEKLHRDTQGFKSLDKYWSKWIGVTNSVIDSKINNLLFHELFSQNRKIWREKVIEFFQHERKQPLIIKSDSYGEGVAFLYSLLNNEGLHKYKDKILYVDKEGVIQHLANGKIDFIPIVNSRNLFEECAESNITYVAIYPKNFVINSDIELNQLGRESFSRSLELIGKKYGEIKKLEIETGRSITVLRRRLTKNSTISTPVWSTNIDLAYKLLPFSLVGVWNKKQKGDLEFLSEISGGLSQEQLDKNFSDLLLLEDSPVWEVNDYRGIVSKIDSLFLVRQAHLNINSKKFIDNVEKVFSEFVSPESPEGIVHFIKGEKQYSRELINSLSDTLAFLAIHGNELGEDSASFSIDSLINKLFSSLDQTVWLKFRRDLPILVEASPSTFIRILQSSIKDKKFQDLLSCETPIYGVLKDDLFEAFKVLAWNNTEIASLVSLVCRIGKLKEDWKDYSVKFLSSIFRVWMPQTSLNAEERIKIILEIIKKYPEIGWDLCVSLVGAVGGDSASQHRRPRWYTEDLKAGEPLKINKLEYYSPIINILLTKEEYKLSNVNDLISLFNFLDEKSQLSVIKIIKKVKKSLKDDELIALCKRMRVLMYSMNKRIESGINANEKGSLLKLIKIYKSFLPKNKDSVGKWLFSEDTTTIFDDPVSDVVNPSSENLLEIRVAHLKWMLNKYGIEGIIGFAEDVYAKWCVGNILSTKIFNKDDIYNTYILSLRRNDISVFLGDFFKGLSYGISEDCFLEIYNEIEKKYKPTEDEILKILLNSPYRSSTWQLVARLSDDKKREYWESISPLYIDCPEEQEEAARNLLQVGRPVSALRSLSYDLNKINVNILKNVLFMLSEIQEGNEKVDGYLIARACKIVCSDNSVDFYDKAMLEFSYSDCLIPMWGDSSVKNLELFLAYHPHIFAYIIFSTSKDIRGSHDSNHHKLYQILNAISKIPGLNESTLDLQYQYLSWWTKTVRDRLEKENLLSYADHWLGEILSKSAIGMDGIWPHEAVRKVMEEINSKSFCSSVIAGRLNQRSSLKFNAESIMTDADQYERWSKELSEDYGFVSLILHNISSNLKYELKLEDDIRSRSQRII